MSLPKRNLGFYNCFMYPKDNRGKEAFNNIYLINFLHYIDSLDDEEKTDNDKANKKVFSLKTINEVIKHKEYEIVFRSGKYGHNPDYFSSKDGKTKVTNKGPNDAEEELTHLYVKLCRNKAIFLLEERRTGMSLSRIKKYFNRFFDSYDESRNDGQAYKLQFEEYPIENMDEVFNQLNEAKVVELYTRKDNINDEFSELMQEASPLVRDEVIIVTKAKRKESLPIDVVNSLKSLFKKDKSNKLKLESSKYSRIRISGNSNNGSLIKIDSDLIRRKESVVTELNTKGIVKSEELFKNMKKIMEGVE